MHNYLRARSDYMGVATIGGTTVDLGGYPGLLISNHPDERVTGELYRIHEGMSEELFAVLDRYEGCSEDDPEPHEYFRHRREVLLQQDGQHDQQLYDAWVYIYNG